MGVMEKIVFVSFCIVGLLTAQTWAWRWQCINKQCVRSDDPSGETAASSPPPLSLEVCRLTCGKYGAVWPQPTGHTAISDKVLAFDPAGVSFDFSAVTDYSRRPVRRLVSDISHVFLDTLRTMCRHNCTPVTESAVTVFLATTSADLSLNWITDESYSLETATKGNRVTVQIRADTVYGARHGLETLSQLITFSPDESQLVIVANAKISDKPVYPHRGLLLDTSRNFLSVQALKRSIDSMAACKLNVLHWHATDSHSFPLQLPRAPQLAKYGAYSAKDVYTTDDVNMLISYARVRGVRILLELDMPAHAGNGWQWGAAEGLGDLAVCVNQQPWRQFCLQPPCGQLNPANPNLYGVLRDVFKDFLDMLPQGEAVHMGGDEVYFPCWNQSAQVTEWMRSQGLNLTQADFFTVWGEMHKKALRIWDEEAGNEKTPVVLWTSHLTDAGIIEQHLDKNRFVIEAWTDASDPLAERLLGMGYRVIFATKDAWYLDHGFWGRTQYHNWRRAYDNKLPQSRGVLGGEVAMWGELVDDSNLDARVWPRATAAAERLWSNPSTGSIYAEQRIVEQRDRLVLRGVRAEAVTPQWCAHNEAKCVGSSNTS